ncbi:MAG TPA: serine/threonine protein kinase, partial [Roseiarcus sp.]|nr:serine/threonine protein kinase [Roseiarcus sp.]
KSALALALIELAGERGLFGRLIGDDRILVQACNGRLLLRGAPQIPGLIERRGVGLEITPAEPAAVARLAVDLLDDGDAAARLPEAADEVATFGPIRLRRLAFDESSRPFERARAVLAALAAEMTAL